MKNITIYTDGSCLGNPGPGGWAAILLHNDHKKSLSGGFALTTNNRMEIIAVINALEALKEPCVAAVYTDSTYVASAIEKNWLTSWIKNNWKNSAKKPVKNQDLWQRLQNSLNRHKVSFCWVKAHAGNHYNELCDEMAKKEASKGNLPEDTGFDPT